MNFEQKDLHPTGKKILKAAAKVFVKEGFNGATTSKIAKEAGVAEGTIYKHFKTKKDLFVSLSVPVLMEIVSPEILGSLEKLIQEKKDQPEEEFLKSLFKNRFSLIHRNIDIIKLLIYEARFHEEIRDLLINRIAIKARKILMKYIDERKKAGAFKDIDAGVAARSLAALFLGHIFWHDFVSRYAPEEEIMNQKEDLEEVIKLFLYGIKSE